MLLADLWDELKALPHTITTPLHYDGWVRSHALPHVVGGLCWYALGWLLLGLHGLHGAVFACVATAVRQEVCRECKGRSEFPLWAILWDTATATAAAVLVAWL